MWARSGFRMVLDAENGKSPVPNPFDCAVVEVDVRNVEIVGSRNSALIALHGKPVILRRDCHLAITQIFYWLVRPMMAKF